MNAINQTQIQHSQLLNAEQAAINNVNSSVQTIDTKINNLSNNVSTIANQQSQQQSQLTAVIIKN